MNTPEEVRDELTGIGAHHETVLYPGTAQQRSAYTVQDKISSLDREFLRTSRYYDINRPGVTEGERVDATPFDMLARVMFELTLWLVPLSEQELRDKFGEPETMVGYARDAVSWLKVVSDKLDDIAARLPGISNPTIPEPAVPPPPPVMPIPYQPPGAERQPYYPPGGQP